jgi:hypothetical protein
VQLTLKRASDLSRAALAAANAIKAEPVVALPLHVENVGDVLAAARAVFAERVTELEDLLAAHFALRAAIGAANARIGVADLLARRALLEVLDKRLTALIERIPDERGIAASDRVAAVRLAAARRRYDEGQSFGAADTLTVGLVGEEGRAALLSRRAEVRTERDVVGERLAALNLGERVELSGTTVAALRRAGVLA